jgi:tetratricopeptide (TPR) repeat protein
LQSLNRDAEGLVHLERAIQLAEGSGDLITLARSLNNRALYFETTRQWDKAWLDMERQLEVARRVGNPDQIVWALGRLAQLAFWAQGDWSRAEPYLEELLRIGRRLRQTRGTGHVVSALMIRAMMGRTDAIAEIEELAEEGERTGDVAMWAGAETTLAALELRERPQAARSRMEAVLSHEGIEDQYRRMISAGLLRAYVRCGDLDRAEALLAQQPDRSSAQDAQQAEWWIGEGSLRARQGRWDEAFRALNAARELSVSYDSPFMQADVLLETAIVHGLKGEVEEAKEQAETALAIIWPLGITLMIEYGQRVLSDIESGFA